MVASLALRLGPAAIAWDRFKDRLFVPVDGTSLILFRIVFGVIMLWEVWQLIRHDWVVDYYGPDTFHFTYWPFDFISPWPSPGMELHVILMGICAAMISLGLFYRLAVVAFFLLFVFLFLVEQSRYLNHFYLVALVSFLMIFLPLNRRFSLDALLSAKDEPQPIPTWSLWLLRFQIAVPMFFGGIAKLNQDWLRGEPLRSWLASRTDFPILGEYFTWEPMILNFTYAAILVDLCFFVYMLHPRVRPIGFLFVLFFHFANARLFNIGIFPWFMIVSCLIFFPPDLLRNIWRDVKQRNPNTLPYLIFGLLMGGALSFVAVQEWQLIPVVVGSSGVAVALYSLPDVFRSSKIRAGKVLCFDAPRRLTSLQKLGIALAGVWILLQVLIPLRHFTIPGYVSWTEEGHNFSWHMMLRSKVGETFFLVANHDSGEEWIVDPQDYLAKEQVRTMVQRPHLIIQFAHRLEDTLLELNGADLAIYAHSNVRLNGRPPQAIVDPTADLTEIPRIWFGHASWILQMNN